MYNLIYSGTNPPTNYKIGQKSDLENVPGPALVAAYNGRADKPVKKFADKKTAIARLWPLIEKDVTSPRKKRRQRFVFPVGEIKKYRKGTGFRAKAIELLKREQGASFDEIMEATGRNEKQVYEGIRLVHYHVGYGLRQDEDGRIFLVVK